MRRNKARPTLGVIRSTPAKAWGSGIVLDPADAKPAPLSHTAAMNEGEGADDPVTEAREWLKGIAAREDAALIEKERKLLDTEEPWLRRRLATARGSLKRSRSLERREFWTREIAAGERRIAELPTRRASLPTLPAPSRSVAHRGEHTPGEWGARVGVVHDYTTKVRDWLLVLYDVNGGVAASIDVAGVHIELAARLALVLQEFGDECSAASGSMLRPPLTIC